MIQWRSRGLRRYSFIYRSARTILGFALTGILLHLVGEGHDLEQALFPFLFAVGVLTAWVAGRPLGWIVSAVYMFASGFGGLLLFDFQIHHGQDSFLWSLGQQDTIAITIIFSAFLLMAGIMGSLLAKVVFRLVEQIRMPFHGKAN